MLGGVLTGWDLPSPPATLCHPTPARLPLGAVMGDTEPAGLPCGLGASPLGRSLGARTPGCRLWAQPRDHSQRCPLPTPPLRRPAGRPLTKPADRKPSHE